MTEEQIQLAQEAYQKIRDKLTDDPLEGFMLFLERCVFTKDEEREASRGEDVVRKFPAHKTYIRYVMRLVMENPKCAIPKSRRVMMTWIFAAYAVYIALFFEKRTVIWQAQKESKSADTMKNKILFILEHIPWDMMAPFVDINRGKPPQSFPPELCNYYRPIRNQSGLVGIIFLKRRLMPNGQYIFEDDSQIIGVAEGKDQLRQYTVSVAILDEFAFWRFPEDSIKGALPTIGQTGQLIAVSSANAGFMKEMISFDPQNTPDYVSGVHEGISHYTSDLGFYIIRVHYTADPEKRGVEWTKPFNPNNPPEGNARRGYTSKSWEQEMEINFTIHAGTPFYPQFNQNTHVFNFSPMAGVPLILGFDFGLTPSTIIFQVHPMGFLMALDEVLSEGVGITQHLDVLDAHIAQYYPWAAVNSSGSRTIYDEINTPYAGLTSYIDPAGFQRSQTDARSVSMILNERGYNVVAAQQSPTMRYEATHKLLSTFIRHPTKEGVMMPRLIFSPKAKVLIEGFAGGCKQSKNGTKEKNIFSHPVEACEYVCVELAGHGTMPTQRPAIQSRARHIQRSVV